ncbi:hypothetical protein [Candidatus Erwinia haradaeae]|nr:hypothetical protein [Candidatus Erwinia haradaeae]
MIKTVKIVRLETCMTLDMLDDQKEDSLAEAGLKFYNHDMDIPPDFF